MVCVVLDLWLDLGKILFLIICFIFCLCLCKMRIMELLEYSMKNMYIVLGIITCVVCSILVVLLKEREE